jgi:DnaJ-class molecular chaperone
LSDAKKRTRYDNGQDLEDMGGSGMSGADIDPNILFQAFFGGGGASPFGGGGGRSSRSSNGGFPGGFQFTFG